jgi:septum formation topological specificity factor MinE
MTEKQLKKIIDNDLIKKSRWKHFIQEKNEFYHGSSWSYDSNRWKILHESCLIIHDDNLKGFHINGNRTYLQTQGMINNNFDPDAYMFEDTKPDEYFIPGNINNIKNRIVAIISRNDYSKSGIHTYSNIEDFLIRKNEDNTMKKEILDIAKKYFFIETLDTSNSSSDFHEIAVWNIKEALNHAYELGSEYTSHNDEEILDIAKKYFFIETLDTSNSSSDFHEIAVWNIKEALNNAYELGLKNKNSNSLIVKI